MNQYVDKGLVDEMLDGKKVLVLMPNNAMSKHQISRLNQYIIDNDISGTKTKVSSLRVEAGGGWIQALTVCPNNIKSTGRGLTPDVVFVEDADCHGSPDFQFGLVRLLDTYMSVGAKLVMA